MVPSLAFLALTLLVSILGKLAKSVGREADHQNGLQTAIGDEDTRFEAFGPLELQRWILIFIVICHTKELPNTFPSNWRIGTHLAGLLYKEI